MGAIPSHHELTIYADYHQFTESVGDVPLALHLVPDAPAVDLAAWDHVVEIGLQLSTGTLIVHGCLQPREEGTHLPLPRGSYTARVCAAGLDSVVEERGDDRYSIFLWPAASRGARELKQWSGRSYAA